MSKLNKDTLLPIINYSIEKSDNKLEVTSYEIELNTVENIKI